MSWISNALTSSIGRKLIMSLTGLFLVSFLFVHLSGNFLLFKSDGGEAFNLYSKFMSTNPMVRVLEIVLVLGFALHSLNAFLITKRNKAARSTSYVVANDNAKVSWFSKNMGLSGSIVLVFMIIHLLNFYFPYHYTWDKTMLIEGEEVKDMYTLVAVVFKTEWWYSILYLVALVLLGFHLNHGFQSAFRTLGLDHVKYTPTIVFVGKLISVVLPLGFATMPIYFWLFN